jgi:hypothetical protein
MRRPHSRAFRYCGSRESAELTYLSRRAIGDLPLPIYTISDFTIQTRASVDPKAGEYVRGEVRTNNIEQYRIVVEHLEARRGRHNTTL